MVVNVTFESMSKGTIMNKQRNYRGIYLEEPRKTIEISVRIAVIHVEIGTGYESEGWSLEQAFFTVRLLNWNMCVVGQCGS
jgi:hypothetical protein